jgi:PAS domain S-box-containing protein
VNNAAERSFADEGKLQLLIDSVVDYGVYMLDADGVVASWNTGAERIEGYGAGEVVGQHFSRFFTREAQQNGLPTFILARARADGRFEGEGWRVRKDGSRFWAHAVVDAIYDRERNVVGFAEVTRDATKQHQDQQALVESERQFRLLVGSIVDYSVFMLDPSGVVVSWNVGAMRIKGYQPDEIIGRHFSRFYTDADRAAGRPALALETAARDGRYESEGWRVRKDGSRFWASVVIDAIHGETGTLIGFAKVTRDITERRAAQDAIQQSERQFRLLTGSITDCALYMLDLNGVVVSWNAGAERLKGYAADEIIGAHFSKFYTESDRLSGLPGRALRAALESGKYAAEGWRVRKDGTMFWASVVLELIRDETAKPVGFAKITRDISDRREAQAALDTAHAQLTRAQKMDALGKLTAGLAHDFNNLLMIIGAQAQTLGKHPLREDKVARAAEAIKFATQRGARITRQLLAFSRQQPLNPEAVDLTERVDALRDLLSSSIGALVQLRLAFPADLWRAQVDVSELDLCLVNLAINARDAMPNGGEIAVSAANVVLTDGGPAGNLNGEFVAVIVSDTGCGIPDDILPKIFDPFFTTKDVDKGTGLGLSQVYGFAEQSGGAVAVASAMGQGTRMTLYLPRGDAEASTRSGDEEAAVEGSAATILVVDDDPEVAIASANLIEELGHRAIMAGSAEAALKILDQDKDVSLVFTDIVMAGPMNGLGLARAIRERQPHMPVLLTTGFSPGDQGLDGFPVIRKPYDLPELARAFAVAMKRAAGGSDDAKLVDLERFRRDHGGAK